MITFVRRWLRERLLSMGIDWDWTRLSDRDFANLLRRSYENLRREGEARRVNSELGEMAVEHPGLALGRGAERPAAVSDDQKMSDMLDRELGEMAVEQGDGGTRMRVVDDEAEIRRLDEEFAEDGFEERYRAICRSELELSLRMETAERQRALSSFCDARINSDDLEAAAKELSALIG